MANGDSSDTLSRSVHVLPRIALGGEASPDLWDWIADGGLAATFRKAPGEQATESSAIAATIDPYHGALAKLVYPKPRCAGWMLNQKTRIVFRIKAATDSPVGWQGANPIVGLYETDAKFATFTPANNLLPRGETPEAQDWTTITIPLAGDETWKREGTVEKVNWITIGVDSWDHLPLQVWIDGLTLE